jgi:hypothetical protein
LNRTVQRDHILQALRRGPQTSVDLNAIAFRYSARIHELRKVGHHIVTEPTAFGVAVYRLEETIASRG